jgi:hypothetical protein
VGRGAADTGLSPVDPLADPVLRQGVSRRRDGAAANGSRGAGGGFSPVGVHRALVVCATRSPERDVSVLEPT